MNGQDDPNVPAVIEVENAFPGQTGFVTITLSNEGTINGNAYLTIKNLGCAENDVLEPEESGENPDPNVVELCDYIKVTIGNETKTLPGWVSYGEVNLGTIAGGGSMNVEIRWEIDENAGVGIMTDSCTFDIEFALKQA